MRIVFLVQNTFTQRDEDRFGIKTIQKNGIEVEVWDVRNCIHHNVSSQKNEYSPSFLKVFKTKKDLKILLNRLDPHDIAIVNLDYGYRYHFIYRIFLQKNVKFGFIRLEIIPTKILQPRFTTPVISNFFQKLVNVFKNPKAFLDRQYCRISPEKLGLKPADFIFVSGKHSLEINNINRFLVSKEKTKIILGHALDYDVFLSRKELQSSSGEKSYAVFIDGYIPFHPDVLYVYDRSPYDPIEYYAKLTRFFDYFEQKTSLPVVIAAHPKADYDNNPFTYGNRKIIKGKTVELIAQSKAVLSHYSTSLNFACLYQKPILFLSLRMFENTGLHKNIEIFAKSLEKTPLLIDGHVQPNVLEELQVSPILYEQYRENFIKQKGSPEQPSWQIFSDWAKEQFKTGA